MYLLSFSFFVFQNSNLSLQHQFLIFYLFALDMRVVDAHRLLPNISRITIQNMYAKFRNKICCIVEDTVMDGSVDGHSDIVEIDESQFGRRQKYNRGRPTERFWIFGLVERKSKKSYFINVHDRKAETLIPIIQKHVKIGSKVFHDDWAAYRKLEDYGYCHDVVVHTKEFVSESGACTNTIEGKC